MKPLMLGACLAAILGAPALAQPYDQNQTDPYYDQSQAPPPQAGYDQRDGYGQPQPSYDQGDQDNGDDADQGSGQYQPPPPPPAGQPGFQAYRDGSQDAYAPNEGYPQGYYPPQSGYRGGYGQYASPQYGYQGYAQSPDYAPYGEASAAQFTGRTSGAWRNALGQSCVWREMSWQDPYGRPAYRWVPRCR